MVPSVGMETDAHPTKAFSVWPLSSVLSHLSSEMLRFVVRRLLQTIPVLFVIITATFFMVRFVPGGPFTGEKAIPPEIMKNLEAHYGLDQPLWKQYLTYLGSIARGDLGPSFKYPNRSVNEIIALKLPVSLELGAWSLLIALGVG